MMALEKVTGSWRTWEGKNEEYEILKQFYSKSVPLGDTFGKYCIHSSILYPRYKIKNSFEKYNEGRTVGTRHIAKNESYANCLVYDVKRIQDMLAHKLVPGEGKVVYRYLNEGEADFLKNAYDIAVNYPKITLIDQADFFKEINQDKERLSIENSDMIVNLLRGDKASMALGMEQLTNFDLEKSVLGICYCLTFAAFSLESVDYFKSTAFRAFRKQFIHKVRMHPENLRNQKFMNIYDNLDSKEIYVDKFEMLFLKLIIKNKIIESVTRSGITLNIDESHIFLNIPEEHIVPDLKVEHLETETILPAYV